MSWNYRLMGLPDGPEGETIYAFHEVYYHENGRLLGYIAENSAPFGETLEELTTSLDRMKEAMAKPMLTPADFAPKAT